MPYKDPIKKEKQNTIFFEASKWAHEQINTLKQIGIKKTNKEWHELFKLLLKSRLSLKTIEALQIDKK